MTQRHVRQPVVAGQFYEGSSSALRRSVAACVGSYEPPAELGEVVGGVVPHAGWMFSGPTAAKVFRTLASRARPDVYVLFGAVHRWGVDAAAAYPGGSWATPLGEAPVDQELVERIVACGNGLVRASAEAHEGEHSIEVQVPFIQVLSPEAAIVPIAVPPGADAGRVGAVVAEAVTGIPRRAALVASTDLTHYGMGYGVPDHGRLPAAMPWMRENDRRIIRLMESLDADAICPEAARHHNACGAGAVAAAVSGVRALGATRGRVLEYTTSADVLKEPNADRAVGYVGMVFEKVAV